jgi:hypothetical protein
MVMLLFASGEHYAFAETTGGGGGSRGGSVPVAGKWIAQALSIRPKFQAFRQIRYMHKPGMCHTVIWDDQYGKIRVNYDSYHMLCDTSLV